MGDFNQNDNATNYKKQDECVNWYNGLMGDRGEKARIITPGISTLDTWYSTYYLPQPLADKCCRMGLHHSYCEKTVKTLCKTCEEEAAITKSNRDVMMMVGILIGSIFGGTLVIVIAVNLIKGTHLGHRGEAVTYVGTGGTGAQTIAGARHKLKTASLINVLHVGSTLSPHYNRGALRRNPTPARAGEEERPVATCRYSGCSTQHGAPFARKLRG